MMVAVAATPALAYAHPATDPVAPPPPAPQLDDAKIREIVDREIARVLTERAAKEAAEKAQREAAEKEAPKDDKTGDLTGSSGFMDTRLAFTLTNENIFAKPGETIPSVPGWR